MNRNKLVKRKKGEIWKAGRLLVDAFLHDDSLGDVAQRLVDEEEKEQERRSSGRPPPVDGEAIAVDGYSFVRCAGCGREQAIPANEDVLVLEKVGWMFGGGVWHCRFCVARGRKG